MPKQKKKKEIKNKEEKKKPEKQEKNKETEKKDEQEEKTEETEKSLEDELNQAEEQIQEEQFSNFIPSGKFSSPVLEETTAAPETPDIDWQLSSKREEEKQESKSEYQILEKELDKEYQTNFPTAPVLQRIERGFDVENLGANLNMVGRGFSGFHGFEAPEEKKEYEPQGISRKKEDIDFQEIEKVGRKYKPRH